MIVWCKSVYFFGRQGRFFSLNLGKLLIFLGEITEFLGGKVLESELMLDEFFSFHEVNYFRNFYFVFMNYFSE